MGGSSQSERLISEAEAAVLQHLLAADAQAPASALESLRSLVVVDRCECGCASIDFAVPPSNTQQASPLLHGSGRSASGEELGIIVWANGECISGLEVTSYSNVPAPLPVLSSIQVVAGGDAA